MTTAYTVSYTNTFTEARARHVMAKVLEDFMVLAIRGFVSEASLLEWHEELTYAVVHQAAEMFQLKFELPSGEKRALNFRVSDDGTMTQDADSGGVNYYALPNGTKVRVVLRYREGAANLEKVRANLRARGWGEGVMLEGQVERDRAYSKDGYGLGREKIGAWG